MRYLIIGDDDMKNRLVMRNEALRTLDLKYMKSVFPDIDEKQLLVGMHKARYEIIEMGTKIRNESRRWLQARGYSRLKGRAFPNG